MYSGPIYIYDANGWKLLSYGNGAAYAIKQYRPDGTYSVSLQGDEASEFRAEFDAADDPRHVFEQYSEVLELEE